ncbi:serine/threonine-protein kinase [Nonomuraea sp. NPDC050663]|uniref:serine/threonine-protein kinase n=1 Tax=Nonomuraea sp. NPDC050663 TaxID=3364370 RepID=UPI00379CC8C9
MSGGRLAGRYTFIRQLGAGGMGTVWHARDEILDREVAVKELTLPEGMDEASRREMLTRAVREAQVTGSLRHPAIVALHDVVEEYGRPWLVMELLRGRNLGDAVRDHGPMAPEQVARIGAEVLDALMAAHAQGLQHRDVKPGNIFLTDTGRVVLTDFGIARQEGQATLTQAGMMIGSPGFIAPERLEGELGGPGSDLWSLGATLYSAVEGRPAYEGQAADRIRATLSGPPPPCRVPLFNAMMAPHPASRPSTQAALHALRQLAAGRQVDLPEATRLSRRPRRTKAAVIVTTAAAVLVAAGVGGYLYLNRAPAKPTAFTLPVDLCTLLTPEQVGAMLPAKNPPKGVADTDDEGPSCGWTAVNMGLQVQAQKDSDAPSPWAMTPERARSLMIAQDRKWSESKGTWSWPEIGVGKAQKAAFTKSRWLQGVGEEAFAMEMTGPDGRVHTGRVYYRLANLVVRVDYTTIMTKPTDDDIRQTALRAAKATEQALNRAG